MKIVRLTAVVIALLVCCDLSAQGFLKKLEKALDKTSQTIDKLTGETTEKSATKSAESAVAQSVQKVVEPVITGKITMTTSVKGEVVLSLAGTGNATINWGDGSASQTIALTDPDNLENQLQQYADSYLPYYEYIDMPDIENAMQGHKHTYTSTMAKTLTIIGDIVGLHINYESNLTSLDVSGMPSLKFLTCHQMSITSLDVSQNYALEFLRCHNNHNLTSLDVSNLTALQVLFCGMNGYSAGMNAFSALDVHNNTALKILDCSNPGITSLDVTQNRALRILECSGMGITTLDIRGNSVLEYLMCSGCANLRSLDVTQNTVLKSLQCASINAPSLDVTKNIALQLLNCGYNRLTSLDISKNTALRWLAIDGNNIGKTAILAIFKALPMRTTSDEAMIFGGGYEGEGNPGYFQLSTAEWKIPSAKNWTMQDYH